MHLHIKILHDKYVIDLIEEAGLIFKKLFSTEFNNVSFSICMNMEITGRWGGENN